MVKVVGDLLSFRHNHYSVRFKRMRLWFQLKYAVPWLENFCCHDNKHTINDMDWSWIKKTVLIGVGDRNLFVLI